MVDMLVRIDLPLLDAWSWLALVIDDSVKHDLVWKVWVIVGVALAPVVADGVGEDVSIVGEGCAGDWATDCWVSLEAVFGVLVPEVECAVGSCGGECAMDWVERDGVDCIDVGNVGSRWVAVALEGEVEARAR